MKTQVLNSKGEPILLNAQEQARATFLQAQFNNELKNALGYDINITTLTAISKRVVEQKFFTVSPVDYMPVLVGNGAWSDQIVTYRDFQLGGDFETGNINTGASNARLAETDSGVDALYNPIINWAKQVTWSFFDLKLAAKSGNWDLVTSKERSRKRNWDLGIQKIAFLGAANNTNVLGLLNQTTVNSNTSLITALINGMNATDFATLVAGLIEAYRSNCNRTTFPTHFIIPEADFNGLGAMVPGTVGTYPVTKLQYLLDMFKLITQNNNFKILPLAYANKAINSTTINKNRYTLLNYDEDSLRMDIPVPYSNTLQNTINGFQFQNVGYGQYTGVLAYRPLEMLYFDW
jgi:Uncharacterized protein conserved in bacteria (DUF2184)